MNPAYSVKQFISLRRVRDGGLCEDLVVNAENFAPMALHGVIRTEVLQEAISIGSEVPVRWGDNVCMAIILSKGRIAMISSLSNIRSHATRIIEHAKSFHINADVPKEALVLDRSIREKLLASFGAEVEPAVCAAVEYFLLRSSGALSFPKTSNKFVATFHHYWLVFCGKFFCAYWRLSDKRVRGNLAQIKNLIKAYPLILR